MHRCVICLLLAASTGCPATDAPAGEPDHAAADDTGAPRPWVSPGFEAGIDRVVTLRVGGPLYHFSAVDDDFGLDLGVNVPFTVADETVSGDLAVGEQVTVYLQGASAPDPDVHCYADQEWDRVAYAHAGVASVELGPDGGTVSLAEALFDIDGTEVRVSIDLVAEEWEDCFER